MIYTLISIVIIAFAVIVGLWAIKMLLKNNWFLGWLRGMFGFLLLAAVCLLMVAALDILSYRQLVNEKNIATISFKKIDKQHFIASFVSTSGTNESYELYGDQWQLDSRIIKWSSLIARFGADPGYRLDRLSGRYITLEDERSRPQKIYALNESFVGVDFWVWLKKFDKSIPFIDAHYGSATFLPMVEDAQYQISLSNSGLLARPLNKPAEDAVALWQ